MANHLIISPSPHASSGITTPQIMWSVFGALAPAAAFSVYLFGIAALTVILSTVAFCMIFEAGATAIMKRPIPVSDGSAALSGLILALSLPPGLPVWICAVGAFITIVVSKSVFGGLGQNPFNPAMTGRVFLLIAFPAPLTRWLVPAGTGETLFGKPVTAFDSTGTIISLGDSGVDAVTAATPLGLLRENGVGAIDAIGRSTEFLIGQINGSLGETSAVLLAAGGVFLLGRRIISWHIPVSYLAAVAAMAGITHLLNPQEYASPVFHLLSGGVVMGAFFIATDYVTSPTFPMGKILFGLGAGVLTMVIRLWGGYPEGVSFAVLLMNAGVPFINQWTRPAHFGSVSSKGAGR